MATFAQKFWEVYTPTMEGKGFKRKRSIFHKLVNDKIVQALSYKQYSGSEFTIQFDFWPLCDGEDMIVFMDSNYLLPDIVPELKYRDWSSEIGKCNDDLYESLTHCKHSILPYFDKITDYQSYYDCMLKINEDQGLSPAIAEIPNLDIRPYHYTLLALGQYELALKAKQAELNQNLQAMNSFAGFNSCTISDHPRYGEYVEKLRYYEKLKVLIDSHNFDEIKQMISNNEEYSRKSYEKNFLGIKSV